MASAFIITYFTVAVSPFVFNANSPDLIVECKFIVYPLPSNILLSFKSKGHEPALNVISFWSCPVAFPSVAHDINSASVVIEVKVSPVLSEFDK